MKKTFLAMAVLAVGLPSLAFAGEPVPMTDDDLDTVAAGVSLQQLLQADPEDVVNHPQYKSRSAALVAQYKSLNSKQLEALAYKVGKLGEGDRAKLLKIAPAELRPLLGGTN